MQATASIESGLPPAPAPADRDHAPRPFPPAPAAADPVVRSSWAQHLLEPDGDIRTSLQRGASGIGLAAIYGAALGARDGGWSLITHAIGVPSALLVIGLMGLPSLYIVLALFRAPLSTHHATCAATRGIASGGLVLAGLAPLTALYVVTSTSADAAAIAGALGLMLGGALGLRHLLATLQEALAGAPLSTRVFATAAQAGFGLFAVVLAWRVWASVLPLLGGGLTGGAQ